jgi:hypothetical protein
MTIVPPRVHWSPVNGKGRLRPPCQGLKWSHGTCPALTLVGQDVTLLALIDDMALGQGVLPGTVQATWAVLTHDPADGAFVQDVSRCALQRRGTGMSIWGAAAGVPCGEGEGREPPDHHMGQDCRALTFLN